MEINGAILIGSHWSLKAVQNHQQTRIQIKRQRPRDENDGDATTAAATRRDGNGAILWSQGVIMSFALAWKYIPAIE